MKVLFIYPDIWTYGGGFYYGLAHISSILKDNGHKTSLLHITKEISKKKIIGEVKNSKPDMIAFSSTTNQYPFAKLYAKWIKETFDLPIIFGGIHATLCPEDVSSCDDVDVVCVGEGEYSTLELVNAMEKGQDFTSINNLWIKKDGLLKKNPLRPLISNLDELPFPDRDLFCYEKTLQKRGGTADFLAGRGCPYNCTYCCNHAIRKVYKGKEHYVRIRSVKNVMDEIHSVEDKYGHLMKQMNFDDDTFTLFSKWLKEFCETYREEFDYSFSCNVRANTLNREKLMLLKKAGCDTIRIGVESGSEWLRRNILKRTMSNQQIIDTCKVAHDVGLRVYAFVMIGLPFETPSMINETLAITRTIEPDRLQVSIFYPYPNTELYNICNDHGFLTSRKKKSYFDKGTTLNLPTLTEKDINKYYLKFKELAAESYLRTYHSKFMPLYNLSKMLFRSKTTTFLYSLKKTI